MKERLFEILGKPKQFLRDNGKLILEKDGIRVVLNNDGENYLYTKKKLAKWAIEC